MKLYLGRELQPLWEVRPLPWLRRRFGRASEAREDAAARK